MTDKEYEQEKHECWLDTANFCGFSTRDDIKHSAFDAAFDCAYALGKKEKDAQDGSLWSRLTDDEKRGMRCRYHTNECVLRDHKKRTGDKAQSKAVARIKLLENLFGKENLKVEKK